MGRARRAIILATIVGCGRLGFDPPRSGSGDARAVDDSPLADAPLGTGLVAYYPMGAGVGSPAIVPIGTLSDASGHGLDGACNVASCATPATGIIGNASKFTGTGGYLVPDSPLLHLAASFTVTAWVQNGQPSTALAKPQAAGSGASIELALQSNDTWFCTDHDPGPTGEDCLVTGVLLPATWTHVAMVWDGTTKTIYFDGVVAGTGAAAPPVFDASPLVIGADDEGGTVKGQFDGVLDELRIYDRALSPAEIAAVRDLR